MYLFVKNFSPCLISHPNIFYNIHFPLHALMAFTLNFKSTLSPSQTSLKQDGQEMLEMFIFFSNTVISSVNYTEDVILKIL